MNLLFIESGPFGQRFVQLNEMGRFDEGQHQMPARFAHPVKPPQPFDEQPLVIMHDLDALEYHDRHTGRQQQEHDTRRQAHLFPLRQDVCHRSGKGQEDGQPPHEPLSCLRLRGL